MELEAFEGYRPSETETYMNSRQTEYFRRRLLQWRGELLMGLKESIADLREENNRETDFLDQGALETHRGVTLRNRDRTRKLIRKIDEALERIEDGSYGYCLETGEAIGLGRLEARPIATLSLEAQKRHENLERQRKASFRRVRQSCVI
jgi:DnaK suppressor protein